MKFRITLAALFLATAAHAGTQNCAEGANGCTYQDGSLTKGETTNSQTIGDTQHNTYAPDSATSTASNSTKIGDTINQNSAQGGNSSANGNTSDNKSSASNNLSNHQFGNSSANNSGGNSTNTLGQSIGDTTATGGSVNGSGNSASKSGAKASGGKSISKAKGGNQSQGQSTRVGGQSTKVDARDQSTTTYETAASTAYAAGIIGDSTAPCLKIQGFGLGTQTIGAGFTFNARFDRESGNCTTNMRTAIVAELGGSEMALLYLAQQDPALWAVLVAQGRIAPAPNQRSNPLRQSQMPQNNIVQTAAAPVAVCYVKPGTTRTIVFKPFAESTRASEEKACARSLGLR